MTSQGWVSCTVPTSYLLISSARLGRAAPSCSAGAMLGLWGLGAEQGPREALPTCAGLISNVTLWSFCYSNYQHHMDRNLMLPSGTFKMYL